jgi:hypothetical protein
VRDMRRSVEGSHSLPMIAEIAWKVTVQSAESDRVLKTAWGQLKVQRGYGLLTLSPCEDVEANEEDVVEQ